MAIQIDLRVPPCAPVSEVAQFVGLCEEAGFDGVGILDSQMLERDVFVSMAMAAQATSRIRLSSAVLNPVTRHLSVIASAAKTVAELAPGRVEFWIGRGFSSVQTVGVPPATVRQMRQCVLTLKELLAGQDVSFSGATSRMRHGDVDIPRILIAAHGPRTIEVAGEVADGVLLQVGLHPKSVEMARRHLEAGAKRAGRNPDDLEIILCATTIILEDQQEAREVARPLCVQRLVEKSHAPYLQAAGIDAQDLGDPRRAERALSRHTPRRGLGASQALVRVPAQRHPRPDVRCHRSHRNPRTLRPATSQGRIQRHRSPLLDDRRDLPVPP